MVSGVIFCIPICTCTCEQPQLLAAPGFTPALRSVESPLCSLQSESCLEGGHREQNTSQEEISAAGESTSVSHSTREEDFL